MTKFEARRIDSMNIRVTPIVEEAFYIKKAIIGEISDEAGNKAIARLQSRGYSADEIRDALGKAGQMIENQKKYGYPCVEWWPD